MRRLILVVFMAAAMAAPAAAQTLTPIADAIERVDASTFDVRVDAAQAIADRHHDTAFHFANGGTLGLHAIDGIVTAWNISSRGAVEGNPFMSAIQARTAKGLGEFTAKKVGISLGVAAVSHGMHRLGETKPLARKAAWAIVIANYISTGWAISTWLR